MFIIVDVSSEEFICSADTLEDLQKTFNDLVVCGDYDDPYSTFSIFEQKFDIRIARTATYIPTAESVEALITKKRK